MEAIDTLLLGNNAQLKWHAHSPSKKLNFTSNEERKEYSRFAERVEESRSRRHSRKQTGEHEHRSEVALRGDDCSTECTGGNIAFGGGLLLAQSFLPAGPMDDMNLVLPPSLVGRGKP